MGFPIERRTARIEDLKDAATAARLGGGRVGEIVGPEKRQGKWIVYEILRRTEASLNEPEVARTLADRVLARSLEGTVRSRVRIRYAL